MYQKDQTSTLIHFSLPKTEQHTSQSYQAPPRALFLKLYVNIHPSYSIFKLPMPKKFLIRHLGNMGDMVFFIPPVLHTLKKVYPDCHITFVAPWGFKETIRTFPWTHKKEFWGKRNQGGFVIHLLMTNPHIDQLIHWHDTKLSLAGNICHEDNKKFPTWNRKYYEEQKKSGNYDKVFELDFGLSLSDNPIKKIYETVGLPNETYTNYKIHLTQNNLEIARVVTKNIPSPRIVLLEGIEGKTTRGWDPNKIPALEKAIKKTYGVSPVWFGAKYIPKHQGRTLTLRENIATLTFYDAAIGVMSGPLHFAAAVGLPTITLFCDHPIHRAAPSYFLNPYINDPKKLHRTLLGPTALPMQMLKAEKPSPSLTLAETKKQNYKNWIKPGKQSTKCCLSVITVDEIMLVLKDVLTPNK